MAESSCIRRCPRKQARQKEIHGVWFFKKVDRLQVEGVSVSASDKVMLYGNWAEVSATRKGLPYDWCLSKTQPHGVAVHKLEPRRFRQAARGCPTDSGGNVEKVGI